MTKKILSLLLSLIFVLSICLQFSLPLAKAASSTLTSNQVYYIKNKRTGKYLTASSSSSGATLSLQNFSNGNLQKFKLTLAETTGGVQYYTMVLNSNNNLKVNVTNSSNADGVRIGLTTTTSANAQRFRFILNTANGQNSYRIMPKLSTTRVFSIANNLGAGVPIYLYGNNSSSYHQDWIIENTNLEIMVCEKTIINYQETSSTCGCACVRNLLSQFNLSYSEETIKKRADVYASDFGVDYTYASVLCETINYFLRINNKNITYSVNYSNTLTNNDLYSYLLAIECGTGHPVIFNGNFSTNSYLPYDTTGHYVLATGMKGEADSTNYTAIISDPYKVGNRIHAGIWEMPIGSLRISNKKHSSGGVYISADLSFRRESK